MAERYTNAGAGFSKDTEGLACKIQDSEQHVEDKIIFECFDGAILMNTSLAKKYFPKIFSTSGKSNPINGKVFYMYCSQLIVEKVIAWVRFHGDITSTTAVDIVTAWVDTFFAVEETSLYEIIMVAKFLGVETLIDECSSKFVNFVAGKTPEGMKRYFQMVNKMLKNNK